MANDDTQVQVLGNGAYGVRRRGDESPCMLIDCETSMTFTLQPNLSYMPAKYVVVAKNHDELFRDSCDDKINYDLPITYYECIENTGGNKSGFNHKGN